MHIQITGATGFIGRRLIRELIKQGFEVSAVVRSVSSALPEDIKQHPVGDMLPETDWSSLLIGVDVLVHMAARVHVMKDQTADPLFESRKTNTRATINLARQCVKAGVKRFIFLSSIKVNGEITMLGNAFTPHDDCVPVDPYGLSKYEAELGLLSLAKETGMEVVIIRPPLVYGPGVKANFASMIKWIDRGVPLPLGTIHNKRSLIALENLVDFIIHCLNHPKAANEIFLISDDEDISTTDLIKKLANALGKKPRLVPVPVSVISFVAKLIGKEDIANRLLGSLQVDCSKAKELIGWHPIIKMNEQLKRTVDAYLNEKIV